MFNLSIVISFVGSLIVRVGSSRVGYDLIMKALPASAVSFDAEGYWLVEGGCHESHIQWVTGEFIGGGYFE